MLVPAGIATGNAIAVEWEGVLEGLQQHGTAAKGVYGCDNYHYFTVTLVDREKIYQKTSRLYRKGVTAVFE